MVRPPSQPSACRLFGTPPHGVWWVGILLLILGASLATFAIQGEDHTTTTISRMESSSFLPGWHRFSPSRCRNLHHGSFAPTSISQFQDHLLILVVGMQSFGHPASFGHSENQDPTSDHLGLVQSSNKKTLHWSQAHDHHSWETFDPQPFFLDLPAQQSLCSTLVKFLLLTMANDAAADPFDAIDPFEVEVPAITCCPYCC